MPINMMVVADRIGRTFYAICSMLTLICDWDSMSVTVSFQQQLPKILESAALIGGSNGENGAGLRHSTTKRVSATLSSASNK